MEAATLRELREEALGSLGGAATAEVAGLGVGTAATGAAGVLGLAAVLVTGAGAVF
jgi:hypothetical protein